MGATLDLAFAYVARGQACCIRSPNVASVSALTPALSAEPLDVFLAKRAGQARVALLLGS